MQALITGASRGLGLELVKRLSSRGDRVFAGARQPHTSFALNDLAEAEPDLVTVVPLDVSDPASIEEAHRRIAESTDKLDVLINNAGTASDSFGVRDAASISELGDLESDELCGIFKVNAFGPVLVTQCFRDLLASAGRSKVVNVTSGHGSAGLATHGGLYGYAGSKAALNVFTRLTAFDLKASGVIVVAINPGSVKTDMGGPDATTTPERVATGMLRVIDSLDNPQSGGLFDWKGNRLQW